MSDRRRIPFDVVATGLLLTGLVVALAVFCHDPADPPAATMYPAHDRPVNLLGLPGAWLAAGLFEALGSAVYVFLAGWFVLVILLYLRKDFRRWACRFAGWVVLLPCAALAADYLGAGVIGGPPSGSGGTLGAWLAELLETHVSHVAGWVILLGCCALGGLLAFDFALRSVFGKAWPLARRFTVSAYQWTCWLVSLGLTRLRSLRLPCWRLRRPVSIDRSEKSPADGDVIPIHHATGAAAELESRDPDLGNDNRDYADYELPPLTLLEEPQPFPYQEHDQLLRDRAALLEKTFADFSLNVRVVGIHTGPVITQYEVALETGLRVHKVTVMADDLALNLGVPSVRIVAPIPGKNTVGIEMPNEHRATVRLKEVMLATGFKPSGRSPWASKAKLPLFLGKDTEGRPLVHDLTDMPHLLIAGSTGTGKSVSMNALILSILMTRRPDEVKMIMIDPKMLELSEYGKVPHLMHPVVKDMKKAEAILAWAVDKMEERYDILSRARVRSIAQYNELSPEEILRRVKPADDEERKRVPERMPYIVIFIDEMADLMMMMKKEVEGHIIRLAQKSRAAGIHLVVATQKPTVDVITGLIKSNLPARICFKVSSRTDSRVVLDEMGADKLLGKGDMLFLPPGTSTLVRAQGCYASNEEIQSVVEYLECDQPNFAQELMQINTSSKEGKGGFVEALRARDDVYEAAIDVIVREGRGSVSLLQRTLGIGYGRAARLIDFMAEDGIVGAYNGSNAREVLYTPEQWEQVKQGGKLAESA
jgi:S-DNA-T family DNA segregation ATPase FtsK/SpoIIIE